MIYSLSSARSPHRWPTEVAAQAARTAEGVVFFWHNAWEPVTRLSRRPREAEVRTRSFNIQEVSTESLDNINKSVDDP